MRLSLQRGSQTSWARQTSQKGSECCHDWKPPETKERLLWGSQFWIRFSPSADWSLVCDGFHPLEETSPPPIHDSPCHQVSSNSWTNIPFNGYSFQQYTISDGKWGFLGLESGRPLKYTNPDYVLSSQSKDTIFNMMEKDWPQIPWVTFRAILNAKFNIHLKWRLGF